MPSPSSSFVECELPSSAPAAAPVRIASSSTASMSSHVWSSGSESRPIGEGSLTELISKKVKSSLPSISVPENNEPNLPAVDDGLPLDTVDGEEEEDADDEEEEEEEEEDEDEEDDECFICCSRSVAYASASMIPRFRAMSKVVRESVRTESFATPRLVAMASPPEPTAPLNTEATGLGVDVDDDINVGVEEADGLRLARPLLLPVSLSVVLRRPPPLLLPWDRVVADSRSGPFNPAPPCVATPPCPPWCLAISRGSTTADGDLRLKSPLRSLRGSRGFRRSPCGC